jgi:hypothetical protein
MITSSVHGTKRAKRTPRSKDRPALEGQDMTKYSHTCILYFITYRGRESGCAIIYRRVSSAFTAATNGWGLFIGPYGGATFAVKVRFAHSCVESSPPSIVQTWAGEHSDDACPGGHQYVCHVGAPSL